MTTASLHLSSLRRSALPYIWVLTYLQDPGECRLPKHITKFSQLSTNLGWVAVVC